MNGHLAKPVDIQEPLRAIQEVALNSARFLAGW